MVGQTLCTECMLSNLAQQTNVHTIHAHRKVVSARLPKYPISLSHWEKLENVVLVRIGPPACSAQRWLWRRVRRSPALPACPPSHRSAQPGAALPVPDMVQQSTWPVKDADQEGKKRRGDLLPLQFSLHLNFQDLAHEHGDDLLAHDAELAVPQHVLQYLGHRTVPFRRASPGRHRLFEMQAVQ